MRTCNGFTGRRFDRVCFGDKIYRSGVKYCKTCGIFMKIEGYRCHCCRSNVRSKYHSSKWKKF